MVVSCHFLRLFLSRYNSQVNYPRLPLFSRRAIQFRGSVVQKPTFLDFWHCVSPMRRHIYSPMRG